jgi:RNA-binding protein 26
MSDGNVYPPMDNQNSNMQMKDMRPPLLSCDQFRGGRGRPGGRGQGTFGGEVHNFCPEKRNDKTLVMEKIPDDKLSLESVNSWFKKFGTIINVAIDAQNAKALVSFSNHDEAHAAWKSEDAVFGNRFVKVFWHCPMEGHGQVSQRMLAASAPLVANMAAKDSSTSGQGSMSAESIPTPTATSSTLASTSTTTTSSASQLMGLQTQHWLPRITCRN